MKPLYLAGTSPLRVALDGPALRISRSNASDRRFPLERVSRIVVSGSVSWSTDALLACADEGIAVCFLKADGGLRARWIGRPSKRCDFAQRWSNFLDRPDYKELYAQWRSNIRRRAIRFCALRMGRPSIGCNRDVIRVIQQETNCDAVELRRIKKKINGLAHARCVEELARVGLGSDNASLKLIAPDLVAMIQWGLHPDFAVWWQRRRRPSSGPDSAISFFEQHGGVCEFHLRETLRHLNRYLEGLE